MAVVWSYNVITVKGKKPTPGFGGRIYFYNKKNQAKINDEHYLEIRRVKESIESLAVKFDMNRTMSCDSLFPTQRGKIEEQM